MNDDGEVEALHSLVRLPWITQQHFVGMLQARRIDQVDVYYRKRGSASYIVREVLSVRERERERDTDRQRERERDGSDVTIVAL